MPESKCLTEGCPGTSRLRGVCQRCYANINNMIRKGEITDWDEVVSMGMAKAKENSSKNIFRIAYIAKKKALEDVGK